MTQQEKRDYLGAHFPAWDFMSDAEREAIVTQAQEVFFKKGAYVHNAEENCIGTALLVSGMLRVFMLSDEGREVTLYRLRDESMCMLSASCVLSHIHFAVHIDASEDSVVLIVPAFYFKKLCEQNVRVESEAYKLISERFSEVMWTMQQILFMSFDRRLALFLCKETENARDGVLRLTHEQIAKLMGSAREVVTRMLNYFASEGYVELSRGGVRILEPEALCALAEQPR
ncbi:MAG: Crp/Fnr family transcriptional regulator [Oscillospiraceae bacterium]|nr:Crp/Fnr family transcriptional regulator [Oscillospiraceae bacterium]